MAQVAIDGIVQEARPDELLIDLISRTGASIPHVCYHPQLGPVQTCDTCMVEADGRLLRTCATRVADSKESLGARGHEPKMISTFNNLQDAGGPRKTL